jgi:hypothetical protein
MLFANLQFLRVPTHGGCNDPCCGVEVIRANRFDKKCVKLLSLICQMPTYISNLALFLSYKVLKFVYWISIALLRD